MPISRWSIAFYVAHNYWCTALSTAQQFVWPLMVEERIHEEWDFIVKAYWIYREIVYRHLYVWSLYARRVNVPTSIWGYFHPALSLLQRACKQRCFSYMHTQTQPLAHTHRRCSHSLLVYLPSTKILSEASEQNEWMEVDARTIQSAVLLRLYDSLAVSPTMPWCLHISSVEPMCVTSCAPYEHKYFD